MNTKKSSLLNLTTRNSALSKSFKLLSKNQYGKCGNSMHQKKKKDNFEDSKQAKKS